MSEKPMPRSGEKNGNARLKEGDIRKIRELSETKSLREISALYGLSVSYVWKIKKGVAWRHLEGRGRD